jgi:UDP-glucose 4-epimerase
LVTGANGFIGRALVRYLADAGYAVRAAIRRQQAASSIAGIEFVQMPDLAGAVDWRPLLTGTDSVVHLAGIAHRGGVDDRAYERIIHRASAELAKACAEFKVRRLVYISSIGAQAGSAADAIITEREAPRPVTAYDKAKLNAEDAIQRSGCEYTILRPVLVYGSGVKGNMARLVRLADSPWPLPFGSFNNRRSLLAVENLIEAISFCLFAEAAKDQLFVVADRQAIGLAEMVSVLRLAAGRPPRLFRVPPSIFSLLLSRTSFRHFWNRLGRQLVVDPSKLISAGWQPRVETTMGLQAMMKTLHVQRNR